jgi:translation initiation factor IF-2
LSKLRVHDLAGEFGVPSDEVINLLRLMDVPVRSHLSPLSDDQVARIRARWEREKRARVAAPPAATRRRRGTAAAAPAPEAKPEPAGPVEGAARRRRRAAAEPVAEAPVETPIAADAKSPVPPAPAAPLAPIVASMPADVPTIERPKTSPAPARPVAPPLQTAHAGTAHAGDRGDNRERQRPQPVVPGAPRPRPVATGAPYAPPRPVASAAPGAGTAPARRDDRGTGGGRGEERGGRRGKKGKRGVDQEAVSANIGKTMASMRGPIRRGGARRAEDGSYREELAAQQAAEVEREKKTVRVNEFITVNELAQILKTPAVQIVGFAFKNLGLMVTINQRLDFDQIELIAGEFGFQAVKEEEYAADLKTTPTAEDTAEQLESRPPVVTIMGHVDHGKTSLLDYIRKSNVVAGESGGITQHIGAYHVSLPGGKHITFLDTPGHEAFTAMRARGAQVTDIVVLVVASDDQVMPQTIEAISHAKNAGVPMIVAINKIDLAGANPMKVKQDLLQHGVVLEEFGGTVLSTEVSAKKGTNIDILLDQILLQAEILDLKANPNRSATGAVIEAQLDPGKGAVATILVSNGTLRVGDDFICGMYSGRVRALLDERGRIIKDAGPAIPAQILGIGGVPMAGDQFVVVEDAMESREIAQRRQRLDREAKSRRTAKGVVSLEDFMSQTAPGQKRTLRIVIKADQGGPAEALADALGQLSHEEVSVDVIHRGVGAITESDILLARASGAIIVGFHVRPDNNARAAAEREGVEIKLYKIIYEAVEDVRAALEGMLRPEEKEVVLGEAQVRELFKVPKMGVIAGCSVRSGVINRQGRVRVIRDGVEIYNGAIGSLRRFKDDVKEVREGFECGIGVENFNDIKIGDVLECYKKEQVARTLSGTGELAISGPTVSGSGRVTASGRRGSEGASA